MASDTERRSGRLLEIFLVCSRLGLTSFGGPVAHIGYFHAEYVERRRWLDHESFASIVALSQALPGPASSQVGIAIGMIRAGPLGSLLAWLGFTLPSAIALVLFAYGLDGFGSVENDGWLHGLKLAAVAIVAFAVWGMARSLASDRTRATIAILATIGTLAWQSVLAPVAIIVAAGVIGWRLLPASGDGDDAASRFSVPPRRALTVGAWVLFFALLIGLPVASGLIESQALALFDSFYRTGSLVFGGGHVVLPLLEREVVNPGWVTGEDFLAGYGAAQAVPGPLFTFSAFLGAAALPAPNGVAGAAIALAAIFLPSFLLIWGGLPIWSLLRENAVFRAALRGVNAAVVGLLAAALYQPVWTSSVHEAADFSLALAAFGLLAFWRAPPWVVVVLAALGGEAIGLI